MDCTQTRNLLSERQDRTLDAESDAALSAHLRGCRECAGADASLLTVRELLRSLPLDPAPPELLPRVLASVGTEGRAFRPVPATGGARTARPILSRLRVPLEAAAVVLLFASAFWYRQHSIPDARLASGLSSGISSETGKAASSRAPAAKKEAAKTAAPSLPKPRTWTAESLPSVPAYFASTDSERIVPVAPPRSPSTLPYGRDIAVDVKPETREGTEEKIADTAFRLGGTVVRIGGERDPTGQGASGTVRVILPEDAAAGFLDELRRIGTVPPEVPPGAIDLPRGPRPGTVAYTVRIRVR